MVARGANASSTAAHARQTAELTTGAVKTEGSMTIAGAETVTDASQAVSKMAPMPGVAAGDHQRSPAAKVAAQVASVLARRIVPLLLFWPGASRLPRLPDWCLLQPGGGHPTFFRVRPCCLAGQDRFACSFPPCCDGAAEPAC